MPGRGGGTADRKVLPDVSGARNYITDGRDALAYQQVSIIQQQTVTALLSINVQNQAITPPPKSLCLSKAITSSVLITLCGRL